MTVFALGCYAEAIDCQCCNPYPLRALLKTLESEPARRLSGHKTGKKPRNTVVFLCLLPVFCLENPQAFSNSGFLEAPLRELAVRRAGGKRLLLIDQIG